MDEGVCGNGYPPGMMGFAASRMEKKDLSSFRLWNERAAASSYVSGVFGYALYIGGIEPTYGFTPDPINVICSTNKPARA